MYLYYFNILLLYFSLFIFFTLLFFVLNIKVSNFYFEFFKMIWGTILFLHLQYMSVSLKLFILEKINVYLPILHLK